MTRITRVLTLLLLLPLLLSGCGKKQPELPTLPPNPIPTLLPTLMSLLPSSTPAPPTPTPTPRGTVNPQTAPVTGESMFEFISESVPDGTRFEPGQAFSKTWIYRNEGPLKWTKDYAFLLLGTQPEGTDLGCPAQVDFTKTVSPGEEVDITVNFTAPTEPGIYSAVYQIMNARGELLEGTESWVTIVVGDVDFSAVSTSEVTATLKKGTFELGLVEVDFCMALPDARAWYPWQVTLGLDARSIQPEGSLIVPATATTANKCFRYSFPVLDPLLMSGKPFTLTIGKVELPPEVNQAENCARAHETLTAQYPGLDFTCTGPGNFYADLTLPEGMTASQADKLILDEMSSAIYGPWILSGELD